MNMEQLTQALLTLTLPFKNRYDLIQGPGGNTSVKSENGNMLIKASGFRFDELNAGKGYSLVSSGRIADYFFQVKVSDKRSEEKKSLEIIQSNVLKDLNNQPYPKPSMETGFHAVLDRYVVHTHSVWSNLLNCNTDGITLFKRLKETMEFPLAYIPFVSPGFGLSYLIAREVLCAKKEGREIPAVFFLENHGVIAHSAYAEKCAEYLEKTDAAIRTIFGLQADQYPVCNLLLKAGYLIPDNRFMEYFKDILSNSDQNFFNQILFPDQTVFFENNISFGTQEKKKIHFGKQGPEYHCSEREARSIHETMCAYLFLRQTFDRLQIKPRTLAGAEIDYINQMDMEKYRKNIMS